MGDKDPVHRLRMVDAWVLTRYEHFDTMPRDHGRYANEDRRFQDTPALAALGARPPVIRKYQNIL